MNEWPSTGDLLAQEERLQLARLDEDAAVDLGLDLLGLAKAQHLSVLIEVRRMGHLAFRAALTGTSPDNDFWAAGKVRIVERFGHSSLHERLRHVEQGTDFASATDLDPDLFRPHGGAFPLRVQGTGVVGVAVVSGLPQLDDHALVVAGVERHLGLSSR